jgi:class 3 adenylate cyclase
MPDEPQATTPTADPTATTATGIGLDSAHDDPFAAGRAALDRHDWATAYARFAQSDNSRLTGQDLEQYAVAAYFTGRAEVERELHERAFKWYVDNGVETRAAYLALFLARSYGYEGKPSISAAWLRRGERLLQAHPDSPVQGYLELVHSEAAAMSGDIDTALVHAQQAIEIGEGAADPDLKAHALANLGTLKIVTGSTGDGFALMEEASIAGVNGELSPFTAGITLCRMIAACRDVSDYRRASEWIEATERYCERQSVSGFPGVCRIHKAELEAVGGDWTRAEQDLEQATAELTAFRATPPQADGYYAIGDIRRLKGDFGAAEEALREAHARGRSPHPALALIRLAQGNVKAASAAIEAAIEEASWDRLARLRLLPARVEIALASGDVARARASVDELVSIGEDPPPALSATRRSTLGRVLVAEGDAAEGARELRAAVREWREVGAPYEVARARVALAGALRATGDEDTAELELRTAVEEFRRLGAMPDATAAEHELKASTERGSGSTQVRRTFMFTDIVGSTRLAEALGDEPWERLLRWHDQMLERQVREAGGEVVNSTGDGLFVAFDEPRQGVDCAIAIQRALRDHREATGFALGVRIGLHTAEASRRADRYTGKGVHVAARVGALAEGGEILASAEVFEAIGAVPSSGLRDVMVKGVSDPVRIASIDWS